MHRPQDWPRAGHRSGRDEHLRDLPVFLPGACRCNQEAAGRKRTTPRIEDMITRSIAQPKSPPCVGPDRHSGDRLAGHPGHVTLKSRFVNFPLAPERDRHRRDQPPSELFHQDRHGDLTRFHQPSQHASGRPTTGSAHSGAPIIPQQPAEAISSIPSPPVRHRRVLGLDPDPSAPLSKSPYHEHHV